jgi:hypothetical protein
MTTEIHDGNRPELICVGCGKRPDELAEYVSAASEAHSGVADMTAGDYVWQEEGTGYTMPASSTWRPKCDGYSRQ